MSEAVDIRDDGDSTIPWREIVAGHEAGHAVVAWHYGAHIDLVSIVPFTTGGGTEAGGCVKAGGFRSRRAEAACDLDGYAANITLQHVPADAAWQCYTPAGCRPRPPGPPTIQLPTNPRAGSIGVQLATGVAQPALQQVSSAVGSKLSSEAAKLGSTPRSGVDTASPITVTTSNFRSLPPDSALGLSAFYISLLALMCGFLGAVLVDSSIDAALGYGTTEIGPRWRQRMPVAISRRQTLLAKWSVALVTVPILTGIMLLVAAGLLHITLPTPVSSGSSRRSRASRSRLAPSPLFAAFGSLGQLLAMLLFVYLALASSGGTIPVQALPSFFRFAANFEPLRQVLGGVRAILYFNVPADAGLTHGLVLTAIGLVFWLIAGAAVTRWYDRRGMDRLQPDVLEYMQRSARAYTAGTQAPAPSREPGNDARTKTMLPETAAPGDQPPALLARWSRPRVRDA